MFTVNIRRVCADRGIGEPRKFLMKHGFSSYVTYSLLNYHQPHFSYKYMEKLCIILKCTPDMLIDWVPDKDVAMVDDHPLQKLRAKQAGKTISEELADLNPEKIEKVRMFLSDLKKKETSEN